MWDGPLVLNAAIVRTVRKGKEVGISFPRNESGEPCQTVRSISIVRALVALYHNQSVATPNRLL